MAVSRFSQCIGKKTRNYFQYWWERGGGTQLTPYGKSLVHLFDEINQGCWDYLDTQLDKIEQL